MLAYPTIRRHSLFILAGLLLALFFHFYLAGSLLELSYPWNTFLFQPTDRFNDWHNSVFSAASTDPYFKNGAAVSTYFPFAYFVFLSGSFFSKLGSLLVYAISALSLLTIAITVFWQLQIKPLIHDESQSRVGIALLLLSTWLCYPTIFALDRGNIDVHVASLCIIYVAVLRTKYRLWGAAAIGIAIALKGYPFAFLLLAIVDRDYLLLLIAVAISAALTLFSLSYFAGGITHNLQGFLHGLNAYRELYVIGLGSIQFSADPYNGLRILIISLSQSDLSASASHILLNIYNFVSLLFAFLCMFFILFIPAPRWHRVMAACLLATLFPNVANDYKLLILLPGLFALYAYQGNNKHSKIALFCITLLLVPKHYFFLSGVSISGLISPLLLVLLSISVFYIKAAWRNSISLATIRLGWYLSAPCSIKLINWVCRKHLRSSALNNKMARLAPL